MMCVYITLVYRRFIHTHIYTKNTNTTHSLFRPLLPHGGGDGGVGRRAGAAGAGACYIYIYLYVYIYILHVLSSCLALFHSVLWTGNQNQRSIFHAPHPKKQQCHALEAPITVYSAEAPPLQMGQDEYGDRSPPLRLTYVMNGVEGIGTFIFVGLQWPHTDQPIHVPFHTHKNETASTATTTRWGSTTIPSCPPARGG